ncbi:MAG: polysaccharide pyruvyl transferase family protein [Acidobacteria bacterium]|nr:polysaccharide pyruvyl transferase family protein [Acidobacteriota bacterium]
MPNFFILHPGGLGDLVLAAPLIAGLPGEVSIAIRAEFGGLMPLLPAPPAQWIPLPANPHTASAQSPEWAAGSDEFAARVRAAKPDFFIDATFRPTWLSPLTEQLAAAPALSAAAAAARFPLPEPQPWTLPAELRAAALDWLAGQGLAPGHYIVCFPGGAPQALGKRWPADRFVELLNAQTLPVLLLGDQNEHTFLAELAPKMPGPGAYFAGRPTDLPLAAALLALAAVYCGNDTGPMHLAQAFRTPGISFFGGGGEWPHYAPWAPGSIGLVHTLPCFGCRWDCCLGHGLCVELIPVAAAQEALQAVIAAPKDPPAVRSLATLNQQSLDILASASSQYREAQADRAARQEVIGTLQRAADERLTLLVSNHEAAAERGRQLDSWERRLTALTPPVLRAVQIGNGLGAGNIGDELMARAFWNALPPAITLEVPLFEESAHHRDSYPPRHRYHPVNYYEGESHIAHWPGLLVGGTPVTELEGIHFPLEFLRTRLRQFHDRGIAVDAVGVGVEPLSSPEARALFQEAFGPIRSWTVRTENARSALLDLGVPDSRVRVGADWAWLHTHHGEDKQEWARQTWTDAGRDPGRPLIVVNTVNMQWRHAITDSLAQTLDTLADRHGAQLAFLANDYRAGDFFDDAAGHDLSARMSHPMLRLPRLYYSAEEAIALLASATITLGQRYHFLVQSVLAGSVPVAIPRGPKMHELALELELLCAGDLTRFDADFAVTVCDQAIAERANRRSKLDAGQQALRQRANNNLSFLRELPPYAHTFATW